VIALQALTEVPFDAANVANSDVIQFVSRDTSKPVLL